MSTHTSRWKPLFPELADPSYVQLTHSMSRFTWPLHFTARATTVILNNRKINNFEWCLRVIS